MKPNIPENIEEMWDDIGASRDQAMQALNSAEMRQQRFEETAVRRLLARYGLSALASTLKKRCREVTGQNKLLFLQFAIEHPTFPVLLHFKKIPYMHKVTQVDMFRRFSTTALFKAYEEVYEQHDEDKPVGLVFDWPTPETAEKVQGLGLMVIHNLMLPQDCEHTRFSRRFMTNPPQTVHVMRYADFLEGLAWTP